MSIKKKFALGVSSLVVGAALVGGGTLAYFNDTATNTDNTFAAGTIDLTGVSETKYFNLSDIQPGATFDSGVVTLDNAGTLDGDLKLTIASTSTDDATADGSDLRDVLHLTVKKDGTDVTTAWDTAYGDGIAPLTWEELDGDISLGTLGANGSTDPNDSTKATDQTTLQISGVFYNDTANAQNQYQGDSVDVDLTFELKQN